MDEALSNPLSFGQFADGCRLTNHLKTKKKKRTAFEGLLTLITLSPAQC
jgi:hypothetical protein